MVEVAEWLPALTAGLGMLAVAPVLLLPGPNRRSNGVFAAVLALRGAATACYALGLASTTLDASRFWFGLVPLCIIPTPLLLVAFVLRYPAPRHRALAGRAALGALAGLALAAGLAYVASPLLFWDLGGLQLDRIGLGPFFIPEVTKGPFYVLFLSLLYPATFAAAAVIFARDYARNPDHPRARELPLVSLGFALVTVSDGLAVAVVGNRAFLDRTGVITAASLLLFVALTALFLWAGRRGDPRVASVSRRYRFGLSLPVVAAIALLLAPDGSLQVAVAYALAGVWRLALPLLVGYGLLRHHLFGVDMHVKRSVRQGVLAGTFVLAFFTVSESAESLVTEAFGPWLGLAAAGALVFALAPLERAAERVASLAVPGAKPFRDMTRGERLATFEEYARIAWSDGVLDPKDRLMLDHLREALQLTRADSAPIEHRFALRAAAPA